jgi:hypothetical protein
MPIGHPAGEQLKRDAAESTTNPDANVAMIHFLLPPSRGQDAKEWKAAISREVAGIFARLGSSAESWWARLRKLSRGRLLGRFFAASRERLRNFAARLGVHHLANLGACAAR